MHANVWHYMCSCMLFPDVPTYYCQPVYVVYWLAEKKQITVYKGRKIHVCIHFHIAITMKKNIPYTHFVFYQVHFFFTYCHSGRCCIKMLKCLTTEYLINTKVDFKKTVDFVKKHCASQIVIHVSRIALIYIQ